MLKEVPENVSVKALVEKYWPTVITAIFDGFPLEVHLEYVEKNLVERERLISLQMLDQSYDWAADLAGARKLQTDNLRWIPTHQATRQGYIDFWRSLTGRIEDYSEKLAISGMNLIVGFHGAVALGAIKILTEKAAATSTSITAATIALFCAVLGIVLFAFGKLTAYHVSYNIAGQLRSNLINPKNSDFSKLSEIVAAQSKPNFWAMRLIYGSLFWFLFYAIMVMIILVEG